MQKQQHRVGAILSADGDPLLDAADRDVACFVDPLLPIDRELFRVALAQKRCQSVELAVLLIEWIGLFDVYRKWVLRLAFLLGFDRTVAG
jgi:hypothetical protein